MTYIYKITFKTEKQKDIHKNTQTTININKTQTQPTNIKQKQSFLMSKHFDHDLYIFNAIDNVLTCNTPKLNTSMPVLNRSSTRNTRRIGYRKHEYSKTVYFSIRKLSL